MSVEQRNVEKYTPAGRLNKGPDIYKESLKLKDSAQKAIDNIVEHDPIEQLKSIDLSTPRSKEGPEKELLDDKDITLALKELQQYEKEGRSTDHVKRLLGSFMEVSDGLVANPSNEAFKEGATYTLVHGTGDYSSKVLKVIATVPVKDPVDGDPLSKTIVLEKKVPPEYRALQYEINSSLRDSLKEASQKPQEKQKVTEYLQNKLKGTATEGTTLYWGVSNNTLTVRYKGGEISPKNAKNNQFTDKRGRAEEPRVSQAPQTSSAAVESKQPSTPETKLDNAQKTLYRYFTEDPKHYPLQQYSAVQQDHLNTITATLIQRMQQTPIDMNKAHPDWNEGQKNIGYKKTVDAMVNDILDEGILKKDKIDQKFFVQWTKMLKNINRIN